MDGPKKVERGPFKAGLVAIIGRPNAGKSTLLNLLVDRRLSAVTPKPQTTRHKILGVLNGERFQVAFLDTPGVPYKSGSALDRLLVARALEALRDADLVVMMAEAKPPADVERRLVADIARERKPAVLAINKIDQVKKPELLPIIEAYSKLHPFLELVPVSALREDGVDVLLRVIIAHLPEQGPLFSKDEVTDRPEAFFISEMVREQVYAAYNEEVPYAVAVEVEEFAERSEAHGGKDYIKAVLYVERESQKAILIGRGGEMLKAVGTNARQSIEELLGRPVHLELWVRVFPRWRKDKEFLERVGY